MLESLCQDFKFVLVAEVIIVHGKLLQRSTKPSSHE